ncbi:oxygen-dependent tRNA uridine(34) hydroxylase TrhO [Solimonas marina]|uniref:tRNA uridine(34) hydroxylase n=1 Tax=Solimonas marina TaxID=2714601 RepID=A0A970BAN0_9GAMM|nr:rhodanese-related sulfurtransferase [Solimonas marina]NKF24624.1 rhodanese-related sulfurtransferase [Solimonas marina]
MASFVVAALYHFARIPDFAAWREPLRAVCAQAGVRGTLLLAAEGINGTIAGSRSGIDAVLAHLRADPRFATLEHKESLAPEIPFARLKIKLKREIVTMGVPDIDPSRSAGTYVDPAQWNDLLTNPDVLVIDTRNAYEVRVGTFHRAVSPQTESFREFPDYVERELRGQEQRPIAMFCTGGIRCEKATAYLREQGFEQVYHLRGGILKYLEEMPATQSLWAGECYVFDERVAVGHGLRPGLTRRCDACGEPLTAEEQGSADYDPGIHCPRCVTGLTPARRAMLQMRRSQQGPSAATDVTPADIDRE